MVEGLAPLTRVCTFTRHYLQEATDPICVPTHVWCKPVVDYCLLHSCKTANNILFCIELIQRPESSLRRHKLGLTDQSILSNDDKTRFTCVHRPDTPKTYAKVPDDVVLHIGSSNMTVVSF